MRALKKTLAVLFALALAAGMVPFAAANTPSDAGYTDIDDIKHLEAVDVLSALRIMEGNTDGSFAPTRSVTRSEAAAIIARMMLTRDAADALTVITPHFSDVGLSHWANKYIAYCNARGIIVGRPDGTFAPNAPVTAVEFAVMMMRALGVGEPDRWVGSTWKIFALLDGINEGILTTGVGYEEDATREETAQYTLNGMMKGKVEEKTSIWFLVSATDIEEGRPTDIIGNEYPTAEAANKAALTANDKAVNGVNYMLKPFQKTVEVSIGSIANSIFGLVWEMKADDFGRPGRRVWTKGDEVIVVAMTSAPLRIYTLPVTEATMFRDLNLTTNVTDAVAFRNGVRSVDASIRRNNSTTVPGSGRGTVTEVYCIDDKYTIIIIDTWFGEISKVEAAGSSWETVTVSPSTVKPNANFSTGSFALSGFALADKVLYTASSANGGITYTVRSVHIAPQDTLTPVSFSTTTFRADGKSFTYSKNVVRTVASLNDHIVFFDDHGYVIDVDAPPAIPNYAYVIRSVTFLSITDDKEETVIRAELLLKDGTTVVADLSKFYPVDNNDTTDPKRIVTYTVSGGKYTLTDASTPADTNAVVQNGTIMVVRNNPRIEWQSMFTANISTVYMVRTGPEDSYIYSAYIDFREVPSLGGLGTPAVRGIVLHTGNVVKVVYVENPRVGSGPDQVFVAKWPSEKVTTQAITYWKNEYVLRNGAPMPDGLHLADNYAVGLYQWVNTDENGVTRLEDPVAGQTQAIGYRNGVITIYGGDFEGSYAPGANINVFLYNPDNGEIEAGGMSDLPTMAGGAERTFFVTFGSGASAHQITSIFILDSTL